MNYNELSILKGVHPGVALQRELKKRKLSTGSFALSVNEYPQTLGAIINGKRHMNTSLALRIEHALGMDEGYFMILQVFYEIEEEKKKLQKSAPPDLSGFRPILFWDTQIQNIDWQRQKKAIIKRVFERGNKQEKETITNFYGNDVIAEILNNNALNNDRR